ncbi:hypothetical protein CPB97_002227 [Podila verticillata]|nr:hypothetical protein CPB97_002227 [Podila verticillata]
MSSIQSSLSEVNKNNSPFSMSSMNHHHYAHSNSHSLLDDRDDDALVPTSFPTAPPPLATSPPKSYWDTAFYSSTPTPKPPPRLAPMPRSPPALSIQTTLSTTSSSNNNTPIVAPSDRLSTKSRYALAYQTHNRSLSHSQAHSHHGNNIFSHPPDNRSNNSHPGNGSPSLGSGTMTNSSERSTSTTTTTSLSTHDVPNSSSSSSSRKIYPGLKNTVGPYKLLHNIGQGSFSQVKMAVDTRTGDHVAIKVMSRAMVQSSDRLGISVRRESDLLKSIEHPNIIGFREVVESSLQTCIVLDYASGGELFEFVADKRPLASEADIQCIFAQIVDAVDYLHAHNMVHRDLKLERCLMFDEQMQVG